MKNVKLRAKDGRTATADTASSPRMLKNITGYTVECAPGDVVLTDMAGFERILTDEERDRDRWAPDLWDVLARLEKLEEKP